jgi:hypothetical protein
MAPFVAALLSAFIAVTSARAVPAVSTRHNLVDTSHEVKRQSGAVQRNFSQFEGWDTFKAYGSNLGKLI